MRTFFEQYRLVLPVVTSVLLLLSLPPLALHYLVWFAFVPLFLFIRFTQSKTEILLGAIFFSVFFSGFITYSVISKFIWVDNAQLFEWFINGVGFVVVGLTALAFIAWFFLLYISKNFEYIFALTAALSFSLLDYLLDIVYFNYNVISLSYAMAHNSFLLSLGSNYGVWITTFIIVWFNFSICNIVWRLYHKKSVTASLIFFVVSFIVLNILWQKDAAQDAAMHTSEEITVAVIQDADKDPETALGKVIDGQFTFPTLEVWLVTAQQESVDMIIYPFYPWSGVLGDANHNAGFSRELITVTSQQFSEWTLKHIADDIVFVTWYNTYDGNNFLTEIVYWQNGEVIHRYQKQKLFPFFDYTPQWAARLGMYSTPIDAIAGTSTTPLIFNDIAIGSAICSELADATVMKSTAATSNLLLTIGSEAAFGSVIPTAYNYLNAQYSAAQNNIPVVRATKSGPSGIFASDGSVIASLPYNETGLIIATIPITIE